MTSFAELGIASNVVDPNTQPSPHGISKLTNLSGVEFFCTCCDSAKVHSDKPDSGSFFCIFGHKREGRHATITDKDLNEWVQVVWAVCVGCLPK